MKEKKMFKRLRIFLLSILMLAVMMPSFSFKAYADAVIPIVVHWSSIDGVDKAEAVELEDASSNTVGEFYSENIEGILSSFSKIDGYSESALLDKPIDRYSSFEQTYSESYTLWGKSIGELTRGDGGKVHLYLHMLKRSDSVKLDISAPKCGAEVGLSESDEGTIQTNAPVINIPADGHYETFFYPGEMPTVHWMGISADEPFYSGKLEGGKTYDAHIDLRPKFGYDVPVVEEAYVDITNKVTVTGGKVQNATAYNDRFVRMRVKVTIEHDWDSGVVTKKATTSSEGVRTYTCKHCKATRTEIIPKLQQTQQTLKVGEDALKTTKLAARGRKTLALSWDAVPGADGYDVFFAICNHGGQIFNYKNSGNVKAGKPLVWTKSGLKSGTSYKGYVKAYVMQNGKKKYIKTSPSVHAYTGNGDKRHSNVKSLKLKKSSVTIAKGKKYQIKATLTKFDKNKKFMSTGHVPRLRYYSTDKKVATVNAKGKVTAKGPGSCVIFVVTHNGISKKLKVTVK